eukprot:6202460-Pleurochrysis_carterae.AAC.1
MPRKFIFIRAYFCTNSSRTESTYEYLGISRCVILPPRYATPVSDSNRRGCESIETNNFTSTIAEKALKFTQVCPGSAFRSRKHAP